MRFLLVWLLWLADPAAAALHMETAPAWEGRMAMGRDTELGLRLLSDRAEDVELEVYSPGFLLQRSGHLEADTPLWLWLPVRPADNGSLGIRVRSDNGQLLTREVRLLPLSRPFSVRAGAYDRASFGVRVRHLPRTPQGYGPLATLVIGAQAMARLDLLQAEALSHYLGACGRVVLKDAAPDLVKGLIALAGCGGRFISVTTPVSERPPPAVTSASLDALAGGARSNEEPIAALWLGALFLVYLLLVWAVQRTLGRRVQALVLLIPPITGIGLALGAGLTMPWSNARVLIEATSGAPLGRVTALLSVDGPGIAQTRLPLAAGLDLPQPLGKQEIRVEQDPAKQDHRSLVVEPRFLARLRYKVDGVVTLSSKPIISALGNGRLRLENRGSEPLPSGILTVRDQVLDTPPIPPGGHWSTTEQAQPAHWGAAARLLRERSAGGTAWLLPMPSADTKLMAGYDTAHAWLLIHGPGERGP